jgi:hypothetical protein
MVGGCFGNTYHALSALGMSAQFVIPPPMLALSAAHHFHIVFAFFWGRWFGFKALFAEYTRSAIFFAVIVFSVLAGHNHSPFGGSGKGIQWVTP